MKNFAFYNRDKLSELLGIINFFVIAKEEFFMRNEYVKVSIRWPPNNLSKNINHKDSR